MLNTTFSLGDISSPQPLSDRSNNRSRSPQSSSFATFMAGNWLPAGGDDASAAGVAAQANSAGTGALTVSDFLPARHAAVGRHYPGQMLIVPAGIPRVRSADEDYPFRPHSAFCYLTGLGKEYEPHSVLVLYPVAAGVDAEAENGHHAVLYFEPPAGRDTDEFYANAHYGEFWVGARPTLEKISSITGVETRPLSQFRADIEAHGGDCPTRVVRGVDPVVDEAVHCAAYRYNEDAWAGTEKADADFLAVLSTVRMWKDAWELQQIQQAVDLTALCFDQLVQSIPDIVGNPRGERLAEVVFDSQARLYGHGTGFDTIAAAGSHATTLHYVANNAAVAEGDLLLIDAGAEVDSLYTGDITRTFPVSGTFSPIQRKVYEAVLGAAEAAFSRAQQENCCYKDMHDAAVRYLAECIDKWGFLPCSVDVAVSSEGQQIRRWMPHGTGHHLGLDTHDCGATSRDFYMNAPLEPGMVFTIEPGLYFREDDALVPPEFRGIGIRIEDDIAKTADGVVRLSESIPRTADDVEAWMARSR